VDDLLPGGVISYRSAFDGKPQDDRVFVTRDETRRKLRLRGLLIEVIPGVGPPLDGSCRDPPLGELFLVSDPRRYLENFSRCRQVSAPVLSQEDLESRLDRQTMVCE
jgi:hypothetical protein